MRFGHDGICGSEFIGISVWLDVSLSPSFGDLVGFVMASDRISPENLSHYRGLSQWTMWTVGGRGPGDRRP